VHRALELRPATILKMLLSLDALRRPERLQTFLTACLADRRGRLGHAQADYPPLDWLRRARDAAAAITSAPFVAQGLQGPAVGAAMEKARVQAIAEMKLCNT
jgi:tRNA nucleotidyltransferase (CCA-adding enzyme)